jgi:hypothetical protein
MDARLLRVVFFVVSGLCDELITRSEESYRVCVCVCLNVCDIETSTVRWAGPQLDCCATEKEHLFRYASSNRSFEPVFVLYCVRLLLSHCYSVATVRLLLSHCYFQSATVTLLLSDCCCQSATVRLSDTVKRSNTKNRKQKCGILYVLGF